MGLDFSSLYLCHTSFAGMEAAYGSQFSRILKNKKSKHFLYPQYGQQTIYRTKMTNLVPVPEERKDEKAVVCCDSLRALYIEIGMVPEMTDTEDERQWMKSQVAQTNEEGTISLVHQSIQVHLHDPHLSYENC